MEGRVVLILVLGLFAGCSKSGPSHPRPANQELSPTTLSLNSESADLGDAKLKADEMISQLKADTIAADQLSIEFKKVIGEPLTTSEREKGYSDSAALDWLNRMGTRLKSAKVTIVGHSIGLFELDSGTLRLVKTDNKWRIDWMHAGRLSGSAALLSDEAAKRFAVAAFLDPLFTQDWVLSEAALSREAKVALAPPFSSDRLSYNRGTLQAKLKNLLHGATGYTVSINGSTAEIELAGASDKNLILKLVPGPQPDSWLVGGFDK
ncbi:MAG: hypothetical protein U0798_20515 [Gemmataceae bacterium]